MRKRVSVSAELCPPRSVAISCVPVLFQSYAMSREANYRAVKSWEISPHAARSCHFSPPSPFPPLLPLPTLFPPALPHYSRHTVCFVVCITGSMQPHRDLTAWSSRVFYRVLGEREILDVHHIHDRLEKLRRRGVRRKAPKLRRRVRKRRRRWRWLDIVKRTREGDQQRIRLTGDGRPQQNVSMFFFSSLLLLCVVRGKTLPKKTC